MLPSNNVHWMVLPQTVALLKAKVTKMAAAIPRRYAGRPFSAALWRTFRKAHLAPRRALGPPRRVRDRTATSTGVSYGSFFAVETAFSKGSAAPLIIFVRLNFNRKIIILTQK